jgi:hypothetical protein
MRERQPHMQTEQPHMRERQPHMRERQPHIREPQPGRTRNRAASPLDRYRALWYRSPSFLI